MKEVQDSSIIGLITNKFYKVPSEKFDWDHDNLKLPKKTNVNLDLVNVTGSTNADHYLIELSKRDFFKIQFTIRPLGVSHNTAHKELNITSEKKSQHDVYSFLISMDAKFYKATSGNTYTQGYKEWVKYVFEYMKENIADERM